MKVNKPISYIVKEMTIEDARKIGKWEYAPPYSIYSMTDDPKELEELTDGTYYSVNDNNDLIGYFCFGKNAQVPGGVKEGLYRDENLIDIGLGLRPDFTGKGYGLDFFKTGLEFYNQTYGNKAFRLTVATFNKRAIKLYEKAGFKIKSEFINNNGGHEIHFFVMDNL